MANKYGTFRLRDMSITFGDIELTGFVMEDFISIVPRQPKYTHEDGAYGDGAAVQSEIDSYDVTLSLLQTTINNNELSDIHIADLTSNITLPFTLIDKSGILPGTSLFCPQARIMKFPDLGFGVTTKPRVWNLIFPRLVANYVAGNK